MKVNRTIPLTATLIVAAILTACAIVVPQMPAKEGVVFSRPANSVYDAAVTALKSLGFTDIDGKRPIYIEALTPMKQMGVTPAGKDKVWVLSVRKMIAVWFKSVDPNSTRVVIKPYALVGEAVERDLIAKMKEILR